MATGGISTFEVSWSKHGQKGGHKWSGNIGLKKQPEKMVEIWSVMDAGIWSTGQNPLPTRIFNFLRITWTSYA